MQTHIRGEFSLRLRERIVGKVIQPVQVSGCPRCESEDTIKGGIRHNNSGDIQKFQCKACGYWFTVNLGFEKMHATPKMITAAMQLNFSGESLRNTQKFLRLQGLNVSHVAILKWIRKYVALMDKYLAQITPNVSDTWRADEVYVKFKGEGNAGDEEDGQPDSEGRPNLSQLREASSRVGGSDSSRQGWNHGSRR